MAYIVENIIREGAGIIPVTVNECPGLPLVGEIAYDLRPAQGVMQVRPLRRFESVPDEA